MCSSDLKRIGPALTPKFPPQGVTTTRVLPDDDPVLFRSRKEISTGGEAGGGKGTRFLQQVIRVLKLRNMEQIGSRNGDTASGWKERANNRTVNPICVREPLVPLGAPSTE